MVKRIIVGAHYGLSDWLVQRVSAAYMAVYVLLFALVLLIARPANYVAWKNLFTGQAAKLATFLFLVSLFWHAWIGMRDILMDYIKPVSLRLALEVAVVALLIAYAGWSIQILWSV
jgi:succinate dehydrogenase / fumarate reductase membrane anchor subunit